MPKTGEFDDTASEPSTSMRTEAMEMEIPSLDQVLGPACLDLKELFGDRYKLGIDESYYAERAEFRRDEEVWLTHIVCQHGHIGVWVDDLLVACTNSAGAVATRLKALPFAEAVQDGTDGANVTFPVEHFDAVAEVMKPRKRRRLSEEHKAKLAASNTKYRFQPASQSDSEGPVCDGTRIPV